MAVTNPLYFLVSLESGAVALLATALERHGDKGLLDSQMKFWSSFAELCKLPLSIIGPTDVKVEYDSTDLLVIWDDWAILIEAKMSSASVRSGQLQTYYDRLRPQLSKKGLLEKASSMAVIFLTPPNVGNTEFEVLSIDDNDRKLHLDWTAVLSRIESSFSLSQDSSQGEQEAFLCSLMLLGVKRIRDMLSDSDAGLKGVIQTDKRRRCRDFTKQVQQRVMALWDNGDIHFNPIWSDAYGDQLYANFGGERAGNVYFVVSSDSTIQEDDSLPSTLVGELYFKLSLRATAGYKERFNAVVQQGLGAFFESDEVRIEKNTFTVKTPIKLSPQPRSELCDKIAGRFCLYLLAFQKLMK